MTRVMTVGLCALLFNTPAQAGEDCPWDEGIQTISATMTTVTVNGETYEVRGNQAKSEFQNTLARCEIPTDTVKLFNQWRGFRVATNVAGGVSPIVPLGLVASPVAGVLAGSSKSNFLYALQTDLER